MVLLFDLSASSTVCFLFSAFTSASSISASAAVQQLFSQHIYHLFVRFGSLKQVQVSASPISPKDYLILSVKTLALMLLL